MVNTILFTIVFLWLFALSVWKINVNNFLKTLEDERDRVLNFIEEAKDSWTKNPQQEKEQ